MELILGEFGRMLVVVAGVSAVLLTVLLVICSVAPSCWIYRCCHRKKIKESELLANVELRRRALYGDEVVLADFPHKKLKSTSSLDQLSNRGSAPPYLHDVYRQQANNEDAKRHSSASTSSAYSSQSAKSHRSSSSSSSHRGSSLSSVSEYSELTLPTLQEVDDKTEEDSSPHALSAELLRDTVQNSCPGQPSVPPQVSLTLHLTPDIGDTLKLGVTVNGASYLPPRQYGGSGSVDAFLRVLLRRENEEGINLFEARTRSVRRASCPDFGETFQAEQIRRTELRELVLEVSAYDQDRYANATELSRGCLALAAMFDLLTSLQPQNVNLSMQPSTKVLGEILLSVVYLPTAQRVSLSVVKVRNLVFNGDINPYIRIILLSSLGRSVKRKKTSYKINNSTPSFSETLSFDVLPTQVENLTFLVTVYHKCNVHQVGSSVSDESGSEGEAVRDVCVGKVAIGKNVRGTAQKLHWLSVLENPRKVISHWHALH